MTNQNSSEDCNRKRALIKIGVVLFTIVLIVAGLSHFVSAQALDELKHSLSLWTMISLVLIINLVTLGSFIVLFAAYQWIRCDLKPQKSRDLDKDL